MTAEQYLEQIQKIGFLILRKRDEIRQLKQIADGGGGFSTSERVKSSGNPQRMAAAVDRYIDLEREIEELKQKRRVILETLQRLPSDEYKVLYLLYVEGYLLKELPSEFDKSYSWVKLVKRSALERLQRIVDETEA
jgi:DNA-directed RNA polymerase specialized sigma24 family protein